MTTDLCLGGLGFALVIGGAFANGAGMPAGMLGLIIGSFLVGIACRGGADET